MSKKSKTIIMAFGTFDGVHPGHLHFFRQARALAENPFLVVSVARDRNAERIKGRRPELGEQARLAGVGRARGVDKAVLGGASSHLPHILRERPNIIALGYDQKAYVKNLKKDLKNKGILVKVVRLKPHKAHIYKSHLLKKKRA
jgi:FAD synthetase